MASNRHGHYTRGGKAPADAAEETIPGDIWPSVVFAEWYPAWVARAQMLLP